MMKFKNRAILLLSGAALLLSSCGADPKDATDTNFETALNSHFLKMKECIKVGKEPNEDGIIESFRADGTGFGADKREFFDDLTTAGLLAAVSLNKEEKTFTGSEMVPYVGFKISTEGEKYLRSDELDKGLFKTGTPHLCYGTPEIVDITNFTEPADAMGVKASNVQFTYQIVDIAPWADNPALTRQYMWLPERLADKAIEGKQDLVLTNNGWVHHSVLKN